MRQTASLLLLSTLLWYRPIPLAGQMPTGRWELLIRGPATTGQSGEIRFGGGSARVLLETADSAFLPVTKLAVIDGRISFTVAGAGLSFEGAVHDSAMAGQLTAEFGPPLDWTAWPLPPGLEKWPVPPRLIVSQLFLGREHTSVVVPGAWVAAMPTRASLGNEYRRRLARLPADEQLSAVVVSPDIVALGLDSLSRAAARSLLEKLASGPAGDARFVAIFGGPGQRRLDIHDRAAEAAKEALLSFKLSDARRGIIALGGSITRETDSLATLVAAWGIWNDLERDSVPTRAAIAQLRTTDLAAANSLSALLQGYDLARIWWQEAVTWLLGSAWLQSPAGLRSPEKLVATFWGRDSLPLPTIVTTRYGGYEAHAFGGAGPLAARLVKPGNAIASEWLSKHGALAGLLAWRKVDAQNDSLKVQFGGVMRRLTSPMGWARGHGVFLPGTDRVTIDPGIVPIFAVATLMHEWQHLLFEAQRFRLAAQKSGAAISILDEDPWLSEGAAEWATDTILAEGGSNALLLRALEAGKRLALDREGGDDPHATGYRLVMAVASRGVSAGVLRRRLTAYMHDPAAFARASGFSGSRGARPLRLESPVDAVVVPEISFTWDDGFADNVQRRLIVSPIRPEH